MGHCSDADDPGDSLAVALSIVGATLPAAARLPHSKGESNLTPKHRSNTMIALLLDNGLRRRYSERHIRSETTGDSTERHRRTQSEHPRFTTDVVRHNCRVLYAAPVDAVPGK